MNLRIPFISKHINNNSTEHLLAEFISIIFNPLIMPTLGIYLLLQSGTFLSLLPGEVKQSILFITAASTFVLPVSLLPVFYYKGMIEGLGYESQGRQRLIPLVIVFVIYVLGYYWIQKFVPSTTIKLFWIGFTLSVVGVFMVSIFWKISAHMTGIGGIVGLIISMWLYYHVNLLYVLVAAIFMAGILGYARLRTNSHNVWQVLCGFVVGFLTVFLTIMIH